MLDLSLVTLQCWLYQTAVRDQAKRYRLLNRVASEQTLLAAARRLNRARGKNTPGVDGMTFSALESPGAMELLSELAERIKAGRYTPSPLRRVRVKKRNGKLRVLGIPTVLDRVVQHALLFFLTPIIEASLPPVTYASRPGLGPHHALDAVETALLRAPGGAHVVRADISAFFDRIPHRGLLPLLRGRLRGQALVSLVWDQIKAWGRYKNAGIPQGAPLSPLLANWYLADVDRYFAARKTCSYVRYMDDILIVVHGGRKRAEECLAQLRKKLGAKGLRLSAKKTRVRAAQEGVEFLGVHVRRERAGEVVFTVDARTISALRDKIDRATDEGAKKKITAATAAWLAYFGRYDEAAGQEAVRYFTERTGMRGPGIAGRRTGLARKVPVWMEQGLPLPLDLAVGLTTQTQPPPGGAAQQRSPLGGHGEDFAPVPAPQPTRVLLETLSDRELRRHWGHCCYRVETIGSLLADFQDLIHEWRTERAKMRAHAAAELRRMGAREVSADAVVASMWMYRGFVAFGHEMADEVRAAQAELIGWKATRCQVASLLAERAARGRAQSALNDGVQRSDCATGGRT